MNEPMKETMLNQMLRGMCQEETLGQLMQELRRDLGEDAPSEEAVRAYLLEAKSGTLNSFQQAMLTDKMLEIAEVNFRTLCDLVRFRKMKTAGLVDSLEEFMSLVHPDDVREEYSQ